MIILKNVNIPFNNRWKRQDIAIENGIYKEIVDEISYVNKDIRDVDIIKPDYESYLLPAAIDPHVHVREPGFEYKENWETCSKAALKGGVAAIIDMPNNRFPVDSIEKLKIKDSIAHAKSYVNYGLYVALTDENAIQISNGEFDNYICGVKIYMAKTTGGLIVDLPATIKKAFLQSKPVLVHTGGKDGLLKLIKIAEEVYFEKKKIPITYICHVSTACEVDIIKQYKKKLPGLIAEATPHHLFLNGEEYKGPPGVEPPLGSKEDQSALFEALLDGTIDVVGTDHAPHTLEEKSSNNPPSGFPGLETGLPLLFNSLIEGRLSIDKLTALTSRTPSRVFNIKGYGKIEINQPANCTLFIKKNWKIGEDGYQTKCNWSPFDGMIMKSEVYLTIVNGNISYRDGKFYRGAIERLCIDNT